MNQWITHLLETGAGLTIEMKKYTSVERVKYGDNGNVRNGIPKATRPTKKVRNQGTCRTPTFPTKSNVH